MRTDSKSLYYKLRMEGASDAEAQERCADQEADDMETQMEHNLQSYMESQE